MHVMTDPLTENQITTAYIAIAKLSEEAVIVGVELVCDGIITHCMSMYYDKLSPVSLRLALIKASHDILDVVSEDIRLIIVKTNLPYVRGKTERCRLSGRVGVMAASKGIEVTFRFSARRQDNLQLLANDAAQRGKSVISRVDLDIKTIKGRDN